MQRKLAAILSADVEGYSRLMGEDELATVRALGTCRDLVAGVIASHRGRVVDMPGDNILAEFASAVDAVQAAAAMQLQLAACSGQLPQGRRMAFRVGINLGDVIEDGGRVYGDGVNIAARIEALADAGGICVSGKVYDEVSRKLQLAFEDLGEHDLHNIEGRVRVYRVLAPGDKAAAKAARPRQAKPSIIVLPFTNMSGDPEQEYFADGLTEDILTDLARFHELFVISRNTSSKYKGKAVDVRSVAKELGVQYVVEGSVRKSGNRVRISVQLIDAEADAHIWAERYDRELNDIFALQDEMTSAIVATLPGRVAAAARDRAERKPTDNMAAYECVLAAKVLHHRSTREDNAKAQSLIERAVALDPNYAHAHAWRACILGQQWIYGWCADRDAVWQEVRSDLERALALDDNDSDVHRILAALHITQNQFEQATYHQQRALSLNPNDDLIVVQNGEILTWLGQPDEGIDWIRKAMRLNPYHPARFWSHLARALFVARRYGEAAESIHRIAAPDALQLALLAGCLAQLGQDAVARARTAEVLQRKADFSVERDCVPTLHYKREGDLAHHRDSLLKAGLPA
ncbi:MAG: adenylate/guanylate cyclase domain-containing protein [Burkholderiales bacterium]